MSRFDDENHNPTTSMPLGEEENDGWTEVSNKSNKNHKKKPLKRELLLKQGAFHKIIQNLHPSDVEIVGQYMLNPDISGVLRDNHGEIRRIPPHILHIGEPGYRISKTVGIQNPREQYPPFSLEPTCSALYDPDILQDIDFIIGRGSIKKLMQIFEFNPNAPFLKDFTFHIKRHDSFIMIEDLEKWDMNQMTYGHAFEASVIKGDEKDQNTLFYRLLRYQLKEIRLLVGYEVDCVLYEETDLVNQEALQQAESVEVKSYQTETKMLDYWYQLVAGDTKHLILGHIDRESGDVLSIQQLLVDDLIPATHDAKKKRFGQVLEVLRWLKTEIMKSAGVDKIATLVYEKSHPYQLVLKIEV